ncbi:glycosyltransferase involved in cell wall biosynthesis [Azorhizobium sp. AG788]|uniref:glycosyltransferase family 4 protein n=1 Tax=Azorhizobium sp. AG788 TaxID=2183897 RepID=UPI00105EA919|nr:glycosyltransferase family 4 protein [Azorhizobium sp. AG788]TDT93778.1 glycosyltransferase involved in cell wall biosynthesis [Azorhizobium sp. AG788]
MNAPASPRILVVAHNHPDLHPGGTEIFAHDLFKAYQRAGCEALFLGATSRLHREARPGTSFQTVGSAKDEVLFWTGHFDRFSMSQIDLYGAVPDLVALLRDFRPDVVHLHHLLLIGAEFPALVRRILPHARIVMTLHDYYPICHHDGLMARTKGGQRCMGASPDACHACFPEIPTERFLLRQQHLKTHLSYVDAFVSPSRFLKARYVDWGLDPAKIEVIANGRPLTSAAPFRPPHEGRRASFGYFGNINPWKGMKVLLDAARRLIGCGVDFELRVHGAALYQSEAFTAEIDRLFAETDSHVLRLGSYERHEVGHLMAGVDWVVMPSVWWENAPLVIQEAQMHRRPVITSGIGGMAEAVRDGVDGLHVLPGDAADLAGVMRRCAEDAALWRRLSAATVPPPSIDAVAARYLRLAGQIARPLAADAATSTVAA